VVGRERACIPDRGEDDRRVFVVGTLFRGTTGIPAEAERHDFELPIDSSNRS